VSKPNSRRESSSAAFSSRIASGHSTELKSIESFRADPKYGGDGMRIDMA